MSIRERTWVTTRGKLRKAMVMDYVDPETGRRKLKRLRKDCAPVCPCCKQTIKELWRRQ